MKRLNQTVLALTLLVLLASPADVSNAQSKVWSSRRLASNLVMPQRQVFSVRTGTRIEITGVDVGVVIVEQVATTTMDVSLRNPGPSRAEAELVMPVPDGAVVRGFTFQGAAKEPTAQVLPREEARRLYDSIVARVRDPALLEFAGYNLVRSSVFPVEARGTQKVRLTYEHLLLAEGDRVDYVLPRSESVEYNVPWRISVKIRSKRPVSTVYSPSHKLALKRSGPGEIAARVAREATKEPGAFRMSYLLERNGMTATLVAYPDPKAGGGYFLMLAGLPAKPPGPDSEKIPREVTLVLDRSGSMRGEKLEQVREASLQILAGLDEGEAFNIIAYDSAVDSLAARPVRKNPESVRAATKFLETLRAHGGTNIYDALAEALRHQPQKGVLPMVLFLTDGLPTIGRTAETDIRDLVIKGNRHHRRVFTFGVGVDVNTPLLERIASETRAVPTFVLPKEDVEVKVAGVFKRLSGPILADTRIEVTDAEGVRTPSRVRDVLPARPPDLFEGDQLVVLGRYVGEEPLHFSIGGNYRGRERKFRFAFGLDKATTRNAFVPRLWASRQIAVLIDAIRQLGANGGPGVSPDPHRKARLKELVNEIVRLSTEFGILTEYTAFLAREGTDLARRDHVLLEATRNFDRRALRTRSGIASVNQEINSVWQKSQKSLNYRNAYWDAKMNRVAVTCVQQISDRAFYNRNGRWVDSRIVEKAGQMKPRQIRFGSEEFKKLTHRLARQGRQGCVALRGEILLEVDGEAILVRAPSAGAGN